MVTKTSKADISIFILQIKKLRLEEIKLLAKGLTDRQWWRRDLSRDLSVVGAFVIFPSLPFLTGVGLLPCYSHQTAKPLLISGKLTISGANNHSKNRYNFVNICICQ